MQHLDEGTIHSWLDGALDGDEAARVEAHVKECAECAAAVAEARGFIAASSRILTALDNAPRGVIPAAAPKRRFDPFVWRVAATVLVVAAGSFVVFRNGGREAQMATAATDTASNTLGAVAPAADGDQIRRTTPEPAPPITIQTNPSRRISSDNSQPSVPPVDRSAGKTTTSGAPSIALSRKATVRDERANSTLERSALTGRAAGSIGQQDAVSSGYAMEAAPKAPAVASPLATGAAMDAAREEPERLKVVGTPRALGFKITLYEVAPGDTVTLTEPMAVALSGVVTTGAIATSRGAKERAMAPPSAARPDAATAAAPDAQPLAAAQSASAPTRSPSAPAPVRQVEVANGVTTISWADPNTGNVLKLSGRMPEARLQQIKIRIERERAAAAKKNP